MPSKHEILVRHILRFGLVILQADFHLEKLYQNTEDRLPHTGHTITRGVDENIENNGEGIFGLSEEFDEDFVVE